MWTANTVTWAPSTPCKRRHSPSRGRGRQLKQVRPPLARQRALASHPAAQELLEEKQKLEASSGTAGELESAETLEEELKKVSPPAPRKVATVRALMIFRLR